MPNMIRSVLRAIRNNVLTGLFLITPVAVAVFVVQWLFRWVTDRIIPLMPPSVRELHPEPVFRLLALVVFLALLFLLGLMARNMVGARLYRLADKVLSRVPVFSKIYISVRQIGEALLSQNQTLFQQVVLVEYPRRGLYSLGFVTGRVPPDFSPELRADGANGFVSVFIPTTPNPTSGVLVFAPESDVHTVNLSVGDAMKLIISGGTAYPGTDGATIGPTFLDKLQAWLERQGRLDSGTSAT